MRLASPTFLVLSLAGVLLMLLMVSCPHGNKKAPSAKEKSDLPRGSPPSVVVLDTGKSTIRVRVEVARTPEERARGLMHREKLAAHSGMLFLFDSEQIQRFWMHNTYIPLDMVFINSKMVVVGIVENTEPMTTTSRWVPSPSRYVLEVNGGFCRAKGITTGTKVTFEGL